VEIAHSAGDFHAVLHGTLANLVVDVDYSVSRG
jgi:hypothetical protein